MSNHQYFQKLKLCQSDLARRTYDDRYAQTKEEQTSVDMEGQEQPDAVHKRVSKFAALPLKEAYEASFGKVKTRKEQSDLFYSLMRQNLFSPAGRQLCNCGGLGNGNPGNCFGLPIEDDMDSIMETLRRFVQIARMGGGIGLNFSNLRPEGDPVVTARAVASGPCSFINLFQAAAREIKQGGTRGLAAMAVLNVNHPDIEKFIAWKSQGENRWFNFNVSVGITDDFMKAVEEDLSWALVFGGKVYKTLKARELWEKIAYYAHKSGEPGVFYLDHVNNLSPIGYATKFETGNPCVTGNTEILTSTGYVEIGKCEGQKVKVWNGEEFSEVLVQKTGENQDLVQVDFSNGRSLVCTPYHKFYVVPKGKYGRAKAEELTAKELMVGARLEKFLLPLVEGTKELSENRVDISHTPNRDASQFVKVVNIVPLERKEDTFCFNEPHRHRGTFNGVVTGQCGELPSITRDIHGEQESGMCCLGQLCLPNFLDPELGEFKWGLFKGAIRASVLYLDNLIDKAAYPLPSNKKTMLKYRPIGLGFFGLADLLFLMELPYGDNEKTLDFVEKLGCFLHDQALLASVDLAKIRGPFPAYDEERDSLPPRRNSTLVSIAPTGTISLLYGASSGVEPYFALRMKRNEELGTSVSDHAVLNQWRAAHPEEPWPDYLRVVHAGEEDVRELEVKDHLAILKTLSPWVDNAISKTVNLPREASVEDVEEVFWTLWKSKVKGGTVYRDGCREVSALEVVKDDDEEETYEDEDVEIEIVDLTAKPRPVPEEADAYRYKLKYNPDKPSLYILITDDGEGPLEVFFSTQDALAQEALDGIALSWTTLFRRSIDCDHLIQRYKRYESPNGGGWYRGRRVPSMLAGISMVISRHFERMGYSQRSVELVQLESKVVDDEGKIQGERCPECGMYTFIPQGGCFVCTSCGNSRCG